MQNCTPRCATRLRTTPPCTSLCADSCLRYQQPCVRVPVDDASKARYICRERLRQSRKAPRSRSSLLDMASCCNCAQARAICGVNPHSNVHESSRTYTVQAKSVLGGRLVHWRGSPGGRKQSVRQAQYLSIVELERHDVPVEDRPPKFFCEILVDY